MFMPSKHFHDILDKMKEIHDRKSHDYAQDNDPFSNFTRAAVIVSWFKNPVDQVFAGILGIKLARLAELSNGKEAENESVDDTFIDGSNYFALWGAYYLSLRDDGIKEIEKRHRSVSDNLWSSIPDICSNCKYENDNYQRIIKHAVEMHGAVWSKGILTYPNKDGIVFPLDLANII